MATNGDRWRLFRAQMPVVENWAYFDNAAVAPLSGPAQRATADWAEEAACQGDTVWPQWASRAESTRRLAAELVNASPQEVTLVPNTTAGITLVAEGFPWREGDNVVILGNEFPSNAYPWMNLASRGVETRRVDVDGPQLDLNRVVEAFDERTRILSLSWVSFSTGWRIDVAEVARLAHERGVLLFLDAIQGLGVFPLDVRQTDIDFFAADGHKWMLGPEGAGVCYIKAEHLERLRPLNVGWNSVKHFHDYSRIEWDLREEAARYEGGSINMCGMISLGASLQLLADFGLSSTQSDIADRVLWLTDLACQRIEEIGGRVFTCREAPHRSGIVLFELPDKSSRLVRKHCEQHRVAISCRAGRLRISPHAYADESDIDRLISALREFA